MPDSFAQIQPDSTGKLVDTQTVTNASGQTVHRQTMALGDPNRVGNVQTVTFDGNALVIDINSLAALQGIQRELTCIRLALNSIAGTQFHPSFVDITNP